MKDSWFRYESVTFSHGENVSLEDLDTLNQAKLPRYALGVGHALDVPIGVTVPGLGYLIRFAQGRFHGIYYYPATQAVMWISDQPGPNPHLVNSTLRQFTDTVRFIIDAFPFSDGVEPAVEALGMNDPKRVAADDRDDEQRIASCDKIRQYIEKIDAAAITLDGRWFDFCDDIVVGDYLTEDVLRLWILWTLPQ